MACKKVPSYLHHKASRQAAVKINGRFIYFGSFRSEESKRKYRRVISEWLADQQQATSTPQRRG